MYKTYLPYDETKADRMEEVKDSVMSILEQHPGISGTQVRKELSDRGVPIGRDRFYSLVKRYNLTLNSRRKAWRRSHNPIRPVKNLIINHSFHRVFEVLFSDYTEIATEEGKLQLLMVEDLVSRYITAYRISDTCKSAPVIEALEESLALKSSLKLGYQTIFHTDKGSEFVNHALKQAAEKHNIMISNTGKNHCYENAFMESLNRTLKHSFGLRVKFPSKCDAISAIDNAIYHYNLKHQHSKLGKRTPYSVLMSYTGKKSANPSGKTGSCPPPGRGARTYSKTLIVKIKKIGLDKSKTNQKR
jgi:transposase InsO family protein